MGGSALMLGVLTYVLLVGRRGSLLELRGRAVDVGRVLEEVLQDLPLALAGRAAEGRRGQIRHVEAEDLGLRERRRRRARHRVRVRTRGHALVRRREAAALGPDRGRL